MAYILIKAARCSSPTAEGDACDKCESCRELNETLFVYDEPLRDREIYVFNMAVLDDQEDNMRRIIHLLKGKPRRGYERFILVNEFHNCSFKIQQEILVPLEHVLDGTHLIVTTTGYYSNIAKDIKGRAISHEAEKVGSELVAEKLKAVAEKEGIKITKERLVKLARVKENNLRECLNILEQLSINMEDNWSELMKSYTQRLEDLMSFLKACRGGIIDITEFIVSNENKLSFIQSLPTSLSLALNLKKRADPLVDAEMRGKLNKLTEKIPDMVMIDNIEKLIRIKGLSESEASALLLVVGARFNESIYKRLGMSDVDNSIGKATDISKGMNIVREKEIVSSNRKQEDVEDDLTEEERIIAGVMQNSMGEVSLADIVGFQEVQE